MNPPLSNAAASRSNSVRRTIRVSHGDLATEAAALLDGGFRLALVAAHQDDDALRVVYLFAAGPPDRRHELELRVPLDDPHVPSLASLSFPAGRFEREMLDLYGITPDGHPQPRRLVRHQHWPEGWHPMRHDAGPPPPFGSTDEPYPFVTVEGTGVYEIPVGPIHAGLIEPGHFRFSVIGETILKLTARLWFTHKGIEKLFEGRHPDAALPLAERISGDTAVGHAHAYCLAVEEALNWPVPEQAGVLRAILLEMERLYNHIADIGALCNDVGYGILHAHALRVREQLLRINAGTTGHRLLRSGVQLGGAQASTLPTPAQLRSIAADVREIVDLALASTIVHDRFTGTAVLATEQARDIGALGYVARASGIDNDARRAHPFHDLGGALTVPTQTDGDVLARFLLRAAEFEASVALLGELLPQARTGVFHRSQPARTPAERRSGVGLVEGWRGTIAHRVEIAGDGTLSRAKIVDPSFFNWPALPVALTDTVVPDFPLTNKSFNLSYAGNDL
jgi:Ni,Fe-hydrogenase III large subunit/Ni,Fe-hydrogenase III component G